MMLLLSSAIADYKKILELEKTYDVFIYAASLDELKMVIEELVPTLDEVDRALLYSKFESMNIDMNCTVFESSIIF